MASSRFADIGVSPLAKLDHCLAGDVLHSIVLHYIEGAGDAPRASGLTRTQAFSEPNNFRLPSISVSTALPKLRDAIGAITLRAASKVRALRDSLMRPSNERL